MASYAVNVTLDTEIIDPRAVSAFGGAGADERAQLEAALQTGLAELTGIARRYGFSVTNATATVTDDHNDSG